MIKQEEMLRLLKMGRKVIINTKPLEKTFLATCNIFADIPTHVKDTCSTGIAITDGLDVWINVDKFKEFDDINAKTTAFIIMHQIMHIAMKHSTYNRPIEIQTNKFYEMLYSIACDCIINNICDKDEIMENTFVPEVLGEGHNVELIDVFEAFDNPKRMETLSRTNRVTGFIFDPAQSWSGDMSVMDIYNKLKEKTKDQEEAYQEIMQAIEALDSFSGDVNPEMSNGGSPGGTDLDGNEVEGESGEAREARGKTVEQESYMYAKNKSEELKNRGIGSGGSFEDIASAYGQQQIDWKGFLQSYLTDLANYEVNDHKWDRKLIDDEMYERPFELEESGNIVVAMDTSCSVGPKELSVYSNNIKYILESVNVKSLTLIHCDSEIAKVEEFEENDLDDFELKKLYGRGGTDFQPVFDYISKNDVETEILIYFTDLYCDVPKVKGDYPVIWVCTDRGGYEYGKDKFEAVDNMIVIDASDEINQLRLEGK